MGTVIKELVTQGHELVALLGTQHGMHDAASLVQRLTAQLDITAVALREMTRKRDAEHGDVLTWEKTMFRVCGEDGHKSVAAKFAEMEAKCAALAAENAVLKSCVDGWCDMPATDAFLAELRAQGAEECVRQLVISDDDDFSDAPNICAMVAHQFRQEAAQ